MRRLLTSTPFRERRNEACVVHPDSGLRAAVREAEGRDREPSGAVIDSQAVKSTGVGGPERGYDGAKRLSGRKRHLLVDTGGLVLGVRVHTASLHDRDGAQGLLTDELKEELPRLELVWADGAYTSGFRQWAEGERGGRVEVPHHPDRQLWRYGLEEKPRGFRVFAEEVGGREDLRVARPSSAAGQGLREAGGDRGRHDPCGHEPDYAPQTRPSGMLTRPRAEGRGGGQNPFAKQFLAPLDHAHPSLLWAFDGRLARSGPIHQTRSRRPPLSSAPPRAGAGGPAPWRRPARR